jgi:hypothetical protein
MIKYVLLFLVGITAQGLWSHYLKTHVYQRCIIKTVRLADLNSPWACDAKVGTLVYIIAQRETVDHEPMYQVELLSGSGKGCSGYIEQNTVGSCK